MAKENTMGNCPDQALVQRAKNGDTDALAQLITRFLPLIKNRAARYSFVGLEQDDFVQEGLIGLFTAVKNYDAGRSASFRTYANLCIHSRMVSCLNDLLSKKHLPLNDYLPIDSLNTSHQEILSQGESDPLEMYLRREEAQIRQEKIKTLLSGLEQAILMKRWQSFFTAQPKLLTMPCNEFDESFGTASRISPFSG